MKPITLALQCADPPIRLTGTFPPTATLTEVLLHFEQESNGQLVIFGRRGEEAVLSVLGREFGITEGSGGGGRLLWPAWVSEVMFLLDWDFEKLDLRQPILLLLRLHLLFLMLQLAG